MVRPAAAGAVLGLALALGVPAAWQLTREPAAVGAPVGQVLPAPVSPGRPPSSAGPPTAVPTRAAAPTAAAVPAPVRLAVPALGVDAPVDPVGVRADGLMQLPDDVDRVGWYRFGPVPGADGSAVVAGHVDDRDQGLGVLAPLREAAVGDEIVVTDVTGAATHWRVVSRELIAKQALPLDRLFSRAGPPRLVLVTCGGPFLPEHGGYRDNLVVVAEPER
ncbi:class F sortase [Geodermatophilus ruber]|uniref:Sortase family protein n=1 Tax=Geodermatophilus ruber TaxID=504800 RepID=A0A1I4K8X7_9ACTN|nr:class F sortase [Geodermatophilus ruber]SFL75194.1 Sortase family protein [Geodermatophilus ruber]